jgi:hypothetical protein
MRMLESNNAEKLLTEKNFRWLMDLGKHQQPCEQPIVNVFETEKIVSYTYLKQVSDDNGRTSVWNHTILVKFTDLFLETNKKITGYFIESIEVKNPLPQLEIEF